ncbi:class I SAM-dependent methyltransferase [Stieleria varia]|nr:class I SAM-dependent methyltransferase [Stieleria varia]
MNDFSQDWTSSYTPQWLRVLHHLIGAVRVRGLEIGCFEGRTSLWLAEHILTGPDSSLDCVDSWANPSTGIEARFDRNTAAHQDVIRKYQVPSSTWLASQVTHWNSPPYDFIYVDGDHRADAVLTDLTLCWPLLRPGGVLICDDYQHSAVEPCTKLGIDAFFSCRRDWHLLHQDYQFIVRKTVGIEAVVVSVNYSDYLAQTLPILMRYVDQAVVVTDHDDPETARVVSRNPGAKVVKTDQFYRNGARFNKGAAINVGLKELHRDNWVLLLDADIGITQPIPIPQDRRTIWGVTRRKVVGPERFHKAMLVGADDLPKLNLIHMHDGYTPIGFFQMWHWPTCPQWMPENYGDASTSDIELACRWPAQRRRLIPGFDVLHLETNDMEQGINWHGRVTRRFGHDTPAPQCEGSQSEPLQDQGSLSETIQSQTPADPMERGVLTAANSLYWPVLRLLVQATRQMGESIAVVDHGLTTIQRQWLVQEGVLIPEIPMPAEWEQIMEGQQRVELAITPQAWIKPWICMHSPFSKTIWIDSDAVPVRDLHRLFGLLDESPWVTLESWISSDIARYLHEPLFHELSGHRPHRFENAHRVNTGVFGFHPDDAWIAKWWEMCMRISSDENLLGKCRLRDQGALVACLCTVAPTVQTPRIQLDRGLNWPVNGVKSQNKGDRRVYDWRDKDLLKQLQADHPDVSVIHWMGTPKPWQLQ